MKYKVGDKVRIKNLDWYNENKDETDDIECTNNIWFYREMSKFCGKVMTIFFVGVDYYTMAEDLVVYWTDEMIEGLVERNGKTYPYKIGDRVILKGKNRCATITDLKYNSHGNLSYYIKIDNDKDISIDYPTDLLLPYDNKIEGLVEDKCDYVQADNTPDVIQTKTASACSHNGFYGYSDSEGNEISEWYLPDGYEFRDENGNAINATKIVLEKKKKKEYPKTYEECCYVLGFENTELVFEDDYRDINPPKEQWKRLGLINQFNKLLICRDAYWKIAGEEMGLGKPWEPDWTKADERKYCIVNTEGNITKWVQKTTNKILAFPTPEMRDAFKKNFDPDIEICKELL